MEPAGWDALLRTAAREFADVGYERASLNRIIGACGLSKSSFYYVVGSKQELFDAVLSTFGPALLDLIAVPEPDDLASDFWGEVTGIVERLAGAAAQDEIYLLLGRMWYLPSAPSGETTTLRRDLAAVDDWLRRALQTGRRVGAVRTDLPLVLQVQLLTALVRVFDEWTVHHRAPGDLPAMDLGQLQVAAARRLLEG